MSVLILACLSVTPFSADKVEIVKESGVSIIHLIGNVVIEDAQTRIECEVARLYESEDYVELKDNVVISDKDGSIAADHAYYYFSDKKGYLGGAVRLVSEDQVITADSLFYNGMEQYVDMERNVVIEDTKNNMLGYGDRGWYDLREDIGHLILSPRIELIREGKEPIQIRAMQFVLHAKEDMFYGYDSVVANIDSINVYCDTFAFDLSSDKGTMIVPHVIEGKNTLKGETGQFVMKDEQLEVFSVHKGASEYHSEVGNINNVEGDTISIFFENSKAVKIIVDGNPNGVLQLKRGSGDTED